jgi:oligopeptide transport system substrate-binding protein
VEWLRGERLILEINPHYLGSLKGNVMRIECPFAQGFATLLDAFEQDQLDAISMIAADPQTIADAHLRFRDQLQFTPRLSTFFIYFRADQPPFDDARVRRAFVHCVDREVITRITPRGLYLPGTGGFIPPGMPAHTPGLGLGFDPERARSLIKEVGISTEETFTDMLLLYSGGAGNEQLVEYICSSWKDHLDIRVTPQSMPWDEYVARRDHDPAPMMLMGWSADYPDPDDMLRILFHGSDGLRLPRWDHPRFNVLVEDAGRTFDPGKRMELYREADRILVAEEVVILPLGYAQGRHLAKPWVGLPKVPPHFLRVKDVVLGDRA